jgi:pyruvate carboxylase subunit B
MHFVLEVEGEAFELWLVREGGAVRAEVGGRVLEASPRREGARFAVHVGGQRHEVEVLDARRAVVDGREVAFRLPFFAPGGAPGRHEEAQGGGGTIRPPMPGRIAAVKVREGEAVQRGQVLLILEAMKMQNEVPSPRAGRVARICVRPGQVVDAGTVLVELEDA